MAVTHRTLTTFTWLLITILVSSLLPASFITSVEGATPQQSATNFTIPPGDHLALSSPAPDQMWSVVSGGGSITEQGLFTAPSSPADVVVRAGASGPSTTIAVRTWAPLAADALPADASHAMHFAPDGRLYVGSDSGLYSADPREGGYWRAERLAGIGSSPRVYALASGPDGALFIGTGRGAFRRDPGRTFWTPLTAGLSEAQQTDAVGALLIHGEALYAGLEGGAVVRLALTGGSWVAVGAAPSTDEISALAIDAQGRLYAGSTAVFRYDTPAQPGGNWTRLGNDLPAEIVRSIAVHQGVVYAALRNKGLFSLGGSAWSLESNRAGVLLQVGDALFAAGSSISGVALLRRTNAGWQPATPDIGAMPAGGANQLAADATGRVYILQSRVGVFISTRGLAPAATPPLIETVTAEPGVLTLRVGTNATLSGRPGIAAAAPTGDRRLFLPMVGNRNSGAGIPADPLGAFGGVLWSSANTAVATVDGRGIITAVAPGSTTITAYARLEPTRLATVVITVIDPAPRVVAVSIAHGATASVEVGRSIALFADVQGEALGDQTGVSWESSAPGIATVSATGLLTGLTPGSLTVTARARADASKQATLSVTVLPSSTTSLPGGGKWVNISAGLPEAGSRYPGRTARVRALVIHEGKLLAGTEEHGIWRYSDSGWQQIGQPGSGPGQTGPYGAHVTDFAQAEDGTLYALSGRRVLRYDGDNSWTNISAPLEEDGLRYLRYGAGGLYLLQGDDTGAQLYRYTRPGWTAVGPKFSEGDPRSGLAIANGAAYLGARNGRVYRLPLSGGAWAEDAAGMLLPPLAESGDTQTRALTAAPDGTLYVIADHARNKVHRRAPDATQWTLTLSFAFQQGAANAGAYFGDALYLGGQQRVIRVQGTQRITLGLAQGSAPAIQVDAIASPDGGKTVYAAGLGETLGNSVFMIAPDPNALVQDTNLAVTTASYLGTSLNGDELNAVDIAPDGSVVAAGFSEQADGAAGGFRSEVTPTLLLGGGAGLVVRLDHTGRIVRSVTRLGAVVRDMEVIRSNGRLAVATNLGVSVLSASADRVIWHQAQVGVERVAAAADGTVVALADKTVLVFSADGVLLGSRVIGSDYVNDVAVEAGSQLVFVTGYDNKRLPYGLPVQVAYLRAYRYDMQSQVWQNWGFDGAALAEITAADTRAYRVAIGRDGKLYLAGENAGGNSIFQRDPRDPNVSRPTVQYDIYNQPYQTASAHFAYYARLEPASGALLGAQVAIPRLNDGTSNSFRPRAITADEQGYIYVAGESAFAFDNRDVQQIGGRRVSSYTGGDGVVLVVAPDLRSRMVWTTWSAGGNPHSTIVNGVAAGQGVAAMAAAARQGQLITVAPLAGQEYPAGTLQASNPDGFLSVWPGYTTP